VHVAPRVPKYEFDVAVSFAAEDREYVESVVGPLKAAGVRVFYDSDFIAETWGEDLIEYFDDIYRKRARYAIIFVSHHYTTKMWTRHERRGALARGLTERGPYVLPVRLDDTPLPGLRPTVGYLDARRIGVDGIVQAVQTKLNVGTALHVAAISRVPRTEVERQQLLIERPTGWEYMYFAAELLRRKEALEDKYHDHQVRYVRRSGEVVHREDLAAFITQATGDVPRMTQNIMRLLHPSVKERAFGKDDEPGNAEQIHHLAARLTSCYEDLMDWAARIRGVSISPDYGQLLDILACFVDLSIERYRDLVTNAVQNADRIPAALAAGEMLHVTLMLDLEIPDNVSRAFGAELDRLHKRRLYP
jgi:hypothetical protein